MNTIKVLNENLTKALSSVKEDNVSIADVVIDRRKLLAALKLQTQQDADILTLTFGNVSWEYTYKHHSPKYKWGENDKGEYVQSLEKPAWYEYQPYKMEAEPCIQFSCNHTVMRFLNRPKTKNWQEPKVIPLNFIDYRAEQPKQELTGIPIDTQELIEALNFVIHGIETDGSRPVLECVCFDCSKNILQLVTADGFRLPIATMTVKGMTKKQVLINRLDIPKLLTFLKNNYTGKGKHKAWLETYIDIRKQKTMFMSDKGMVEFDNQSGSYPNYNQLIPDNGTHIQVIASELLEAVKALKHIADDGSGIIRLKFNKYPSRVTLSARSEELGESTADCQALVDRECYIAVNAKYLVDFLSTCNNNVIDLFVDKPSSPMAIYKNDHQFETVMPMFVQW